VCVCVCLRIGLRFNIHSTNIQRIPSSHVLTSSFKNTHVHTHSFTHTQINTCYLLEDLARKRRHTHCLSLTHNSRTNSLTDSHTHTHMQTVCRRITNVDCNTLRHSVTHFNTLRHTATHCNSLQHTATTHCNIFTQFQAICQRIQCMNHLQ